MPRKASIKKTEPAKPRAKKSGSRPVAKIKTRKPSLRARRIAVPQKKSSPFRKPDLNPIIEPREHNFWEMKATFNPAAMQAGGRVHLLYRAIGGNDISVLGYAGSDDGVTIKERSSLPAFEHWTTRKKTADDEVVPVPAENINYCSGGGWNGGSEDPRLTLIEDDARAYLTYTAFDGWGSVRIALSSISVDDFLNQRWNWKEPVLISPLGEVHKNWILFPEKIKGKYAILHSISPEILIDYVDSLDEFENDTL